MPPYLPSTTPPTQRFRSSRGRRGKSQSANSDLLTTPSPFASSRSPNNALCRRDTRDPPGSWSDRAQAPRADVGNECFASLPRFFATSAIAAKAWTTGLGSGAAAS